MITCHLKVWQFFTNNILPYICSKCKRYMKSNENFNFQTDVKILKAFVPLLHVGVHIDLPRHSISWEKKLLKMAMYVHSKLVK